MDKQITETIPEFFFIWNIEEEKVIYLTDSFTDFTNEDDPPQNMAAIKRVINGSDQSKFDSLFEGLKQGKYAHDLMLRSTSSSGKQLWLNLITFPIKDNGKVTKVAGHMMNVTKKVTHERKLQKEVDRIEDILHILVHDLRGPLGNIINMSRVQKQVLDEEHNATAYSLTEIIEREARDSVRLLQNMIEMVDLEDGELSLDVTECDLIDLLKKVISPFQPNIDDKGLNLNIIVPDKPVMAKLDLVKFKLVLQNLLSNAIKFTEEKGDIDIVLRDEKNLARLSFIDTGVGIPEDRQAFLFKKFSSHTKGTKGEVTTGLGLSIAKKIVELHDGRIEVKSQEGAGSDFTIYLPKDGKPKTTTIETELPKS